MDLKQLFQDDDAVSPVIGVILMVAITVILAAVIASFVLGLGDQTTNTTPQASFSFDYDSTGAGSDDFGSDTLGDGGILTITHDGGDTIEPERLTLTDGETETGDLTNAGASEVAAGTTVEVAVNDDDTIRVVYSGESGDSSSTLATWDGPDA